MSISELNILLSKLDKPMICKTIPEHVDNAEAPPSHAMCSFNDLQDLIRSSRLMTAFGECPAMEADVHRLFNDLLKSGIANIGLELISDLWVAACMLHKISEATRWKIHPQYLCTQIFRLRAVMSTLEIEHIASVLMNQFEPPNQLIELCKFFATLSEAGRAVGTAIVSRIVREACGLRSSRVSQPLKMADLTALIRENRKVNADASDKDKMLLVNAINFMLCTELGNVTRSEAEDLHELITDIASYGSGGFSQLNGISTALLDISEFTLLHIMPILRQCGANAQTLEG